MYGTKAICERRAYVGIKTSSVVERWKPAEERWRDVLRRAQDSAHPRTTDPHVVFAPAAYAEDLDVWALRHVDALRLERWDEEGKDFFRPVTGGLSLNPIDPEP